MSIGTTRPDRPGCRAPSRTTSCRSTVSGRTASISAARRAFAAHRSKRASAESVSRSSRGLGADERRELVEDPLDLGPLRDLRLAPGVAQLDRHERLDEQGLAAARRVVDDSLDPAARLGPHGQDVAPVAQGDDRLLERPAGRLGLDQRIEPAPQAVVGHPDRRAQAAEARRGRIEQLADRIEAPRERAPEGRQRVQLARELVEQRPALLGEGRRQPACRVERLRQAQELLRVEAPAPGGPLDPRPDVVGGTDAGRRALAEERAGLIGLVEAAPDDHRVRRRLQPFGEAPARREARVVGETLPDGRELEQRDRLRVHQRETLGLPAIVNRHGRSTHGSPAKSIPIAARRLDRGAAGRPPGVPSRWTGRAGSSRSLPVRLRSRLNAAPTRPGPAASRAAGRARDPGLDALDIGGAERAPAAQLGLDPRGADRVDPLERLDGADQDRVRRADRAGHDVETVVHAVHKIDVGPARLAVHRPAPGGLAEAGVGRPVVRPEIGLDLDDPPDPPADRARRARGASRAAPARPRALAG